MIEILFGIGVLVAFGYFFYQLTHEFFSSLQAMMDGQQRTTQRFSDMVQGMQIDHEKQMKVMQEQFLKALQPKVIKQASPVLPREEEANTIEVKEEETVEVNESQRIPIMDGMKVKFDDTPEILPISIS